MFYRFSILFSPLVWMLVAGCAVETYVEPTEDTRSDAKGRPDTGPFDVPEDRFDAMARDRHAELPQPRDLCVPACEDRECGDDGCGGVCGACETDDPCSPELSCTDGLCVGPGYDCDDGNPCTSDYCVDQDGAPLCAHAHLLDVCDDGFLCTQSDACQGGVCRGIPQDGLCDDGDVCNGLETCSLTAGCLAGAPPACDDGDPCTEDSCDPSSGCVSLALECEEHWICDGGQCVYVPYCGDDSCDPAEACSSCPVDCPCGCGGACLEGTCVFSVCDGLACGDDGCGGTYGACSDPEVCVEGACVCQPDCAGAECGVDGCGGSCGLCQLPETCSTSGSCTWSAGQDALHLVVLGDSTEAGIGNGSGAYGEANTQWTYSGHTLLGYHLVSSDPSFIPPSESTWPVHDPGTGIAVLLPSHQYIVSNDPSAEYDFGEAEEITVYYVERTSEHAPVFDLVSGGVTTSIDTWVPPLSFGASITKDVGRVLAATTLAIDGPVQLGNLRTLDRGDGKADDGTVVILGFTTGAPVRFRNLAVSSTTLLDSSPANLSRGVTTTGQIDKAFAFDADVICIGWGTNDSKQGVSTPEAFYGDLVSRIEGILSWKADALVVLNTDPAGQGIYANNVEYNEVIRQVAAETGAILLDIEILFEAHPEWYADDVHPNGAGYQGIGDGLVLLWESMGL